MQQNFIKCKITRNIRDLYSYNIWRNDILYDCLKYNIGKDKLFIKILTKDEGLYFKSIKGTLNHILAADILWYLRLFERKEIEISSKKFNINEVSNLWISEDFESFLDHEDGIEWF